MNRLLPGLLAACLTLLAGCGDRKPVAQEQPTAPVVVKHSGVVTLKGAVEGCPLLVVLDDGTQEALIPIGLDKQYQQEGLRLKFSYRPSRASSGSCTKGNPAILEDITVIGTAGK